MSVKKLTRSESARAEITRDPVFLLQRKEYHLNEDKYGEHNLQNDGDGPVWPNGKAASDKTLEKLGVLVPYWGTPSGVFYSRAEAEQYAISRKYDWGRKDQDWRVYCTCAEGELAQVLNDHELSMRAVEKILGNLVVKEHGSTDFDKS